MTPKTIIHAIPLEAVNQDRFWSHVPDRPADGCWEWNAGRGATEYGLFQVAGRPYVAHRISYLIDRGAIPEGQVIRHRCDNKRCVRPDHLEHGSYSDNSIDAVTRGPIPGHRNDWMMLRTAARMLGVRPDTIRQQIAKGRLKARHFAPGVPWRIQMSEVIRYGAERQARMGYGMDPRWTPAWVIAEVNAMAAERELGRRGRPTKENR